ncbi:MAG TPA: glycosyl hydrolase [Polyangia bacterium]|nr:glycosyl hydrolase [Polyangia bacterium]
MRRSFLLASSAAVLGALLLTSCGTSGGGSGSGGSPGSGGGPGSGGATGSGGGPGSGGTTGSGGGPGSGGSAQGGGGSGGVTGAGGTSATGGAIGSGGNAGVDGSAGRGGSVGSGGAIGKGGAGGSGGSTGVGGSATGGAGSGGAGGTAGAGGSAGGGAAVPSAGCGKTSTLTFGTVPGENANAAAGSGNGVGHGTGGYVTINDSNAGGARGFALRLPDNYDKSKPYWLIFGFHWNGGNAAQVDNGGTNGTWWSYYGFQRESNNGAIFVAPDGLNAGWANSGGRDLNFVDDMVKLVEENYCVDTTHIVTSGFSYGGGMSYELACARAKVFHAAIIYEGGQLSGCDGGNDPIALWQTEGLTDTTVSMSLATPIRDRFVKNDGCTAQNPPQPPQPPPYLSPGGHVCTNYSGCSNGHPVRWCVHQSGHTPGPIDGTSDLYNSCATPPKSCSATCPCTWTPDDAWSWLTSF